MKINNLFPTPLGLSQYAKHSEIKDLLVKHCLEIESTHRSGGDNWISKNLYNTCDTYNILKDSVFNDLNKWIEEEANKFKNTLGQTKPIIPVKGWFNIYRKNSFQEYHNHNFNYISAIYYLKSKESDAKISFKSPIHPNINDADFIQDNAYTWSSCSVIPNEGVLLLFKSDLNHCVEPQNIDNTRISLAYNYDLKK